MAEAYSPSVSRVSDAKLSTAISQDLNFDIEEPDANSTPAIPGLFVSASEAGALSGLATDRGVKQMKVIEQVGDGGYR